MSASTSPLEFLTVCRLCQQPIRFGVPIIGEKPEAQATRYVQILQQHIDAKHFRQAAQIRKMAGTFAETFGYLLIVQAFHTAEPALLGAYDASRAPIHDLTRKYRLPDDDLYKLIDEATPASPFKKGLVDAAMPLARKIRDILQESGEYEHPVVKAAREGAGKPVTA